MSHTIITPLTGLSPGSSLVEIVERKGLGHPDTLRDALDILIEQGRMAKEEDEQVVVLPGDGAAYGMGLSATSGAMERDLDFIYVCYDNKGYGNTGQQYFAATPHGAKTATSKSSRGFAGYKKDLLSIWAAHKPAYVATVIGAEPLDLAKKLRRPKA